MRHKRRRVKVVPILFLIIIVLILIGGIYLWINKDNHKKVSKKEKVEEKVSLADIKKQYNTYVTVKKDSALYNNKGKKIGTISKDTQIILDDEYEVKEKYLKLKDQELYVRYDSVSKAKEFTYEDEYKTYKNYIPFDIKIKTKNKYKLYNEDNVSYEINNSDTYDVYVKYDDKYGISFNNQLFYIKSEDVENTEDVESDLKYTEEVAVLNYHYTIDEKSDEGLECRQTICMTETQVDEEIKYLKDNNFYPVTMEDLYLFLNGNIRLPEKSVAITIDDGWYLARMIAILEKYQMHGTLYLIGSLASPNDYKSDYLEIHSHTWDMHKLNVCPGSHHGGGLLCLDEETILEDLKKSRESLNNTEVFCYPFYEYNARAIGLLKKAGFKMAFAGGSRKAKPGDDLFEIPRYELSNSTSINYFKNIVN